MALKNSRKKRRKQTAGGGGALGLAAAGGALLLLLRRRRKAKQQPPVFQTEPRVVTGQGHAGSAGTDDATLARRVETVIFRGADAPKGDVDVNAEFGVVFLRGQVASSDQAAELVESARAVDGVKDVRNLLKPAGPAAA